MVTIAHVIDAVIRLKDQFSATLQNVNTHLTEFQKKAQYMGKNITSVGKNVEKIGKSLTVGVTMPLVGIGVAAAKAATAFEHQMADIRKEVGATGIPVAQVNSLMSQMSQSSLKWSVDFGQSTDSINEGFLTLVKDGFSASESINIMQTSLYTARGANEDLATVVDKLGSSLEAYGMKSNNATITTQNMAHMADTFAYIANHTKANITSLGEAFSTVGATANALKQPMEQTAAAIGILESNGVDASTAATSLQAGLVNLSKPTKKMQASLKEMGFTAFDSKGNMKNLATILGEMEKKTAGWTNQQKQAAIATIFGKESLASWNILLHKGGDYLGTLSSNANNATGEVKKLSDSMKNTAQNKFKELKESVHALGVVFGRDILPSLTPIVIKLTEMIKSFSSLDENTKKSILKFAMFAATVGPIIWIIGKLTSGIGNAFKNFAKLSREVQRAGGLMAWIATPGHMVVIALAALVVAAILLVKNWDKVTKVFDKFKKTLKDHESAIKTTAKVLWAIFGPALLKIGAQAVIAGTKLAVSLTAKIIELGMQAVLTGIKITVSFVASLIKTSAQVVATALAITGRLIVALASFVVQALIATGIINAQTGAWLLNKIQIIAITGALVLHKIQMIASSAATGVVTAATWLFNAALAANPIVATIAALALLGLAIYEVVKHWKDICTWIEKAWNWLTKWNGTKAENKTATFTTTTIANVGASVGGSADIGANALGTSYWSGGETWVGEHGPEKVWLPSGSKVTDHRNSINSSSNSVTIAKLADTIIVREDADIDRIVDKLVKKLDKVSYNMA